MSACVHNAEYGFDYPCFDCVELTDEQQLLGERLRSIQVNPRTVAPSSHNGVAPAVDENANAWNRGTATDHRGLPYLDENLAPIPVKKFADNRRKYETIIRKHRTAGV